MLLFRSTLTLSSQWRAGNCTLLHQPQRPLRRRGRHLDRVPLRIPVQRLRSLPRLQPLPLRHQPQLRQLPLRLHQPPLRRVSLLGRGFLRSDTNRPSQSMKLTAPSRNKFSLFAITPWISSRCPTSLVRLKLVRCPHLLAPTLAQLSPAFVALGRNRRTCPASLSSVPWLRVRGAQAQ